MMLTDLETIQAAIGTAWGVPATPELRKLAYGILAASHRGMPQPWLIEQLNRYLETQHSRTDPAACAAIVDALRNGASSAALN